MPLPFLIGAAAAAAAATAVAVAVAFSDDDSSSSSSDSYSDNEAAERKKAEIERKERQRTEKRQALKASYDERLELDGLRLKSLLEGIAKVQGQIKSKVPIDGLARVSLNPGSGSKKILNSKIIDHRPSLNKFHSNAHVFEIIYGGRVMSKEETMQLASSINALEEQIDKVDDLITKLNK